MLHYYNSFLAANMLTIFLKNSKELARSLAGSWCRIFSELSDKIG